MITKFRLGSPEEAGMSPERVQRVVGLAESWVEHGITPALVILAARRGVIVVHRAFGRLTAADDSPPLELDSIFPLASLTKPITATLAMILVEEGLLGLNRPVQWYIPEFVGEGKDKVMVHHLMTHTSGIKDELVNEYARERKGEAEIPPPDMIQHPVINEYLHLRYDAPLWKPPGEEMYYSTYGYTLLGEIVQRVSGESLDNLARDRIFGPLGMVDTSYIVPDSMSDRIVKRQPDDPGYFYDSRNFQKTPWGGAGVYSTAMDMVVFGQMFLNGGAYGNARVLSPATVAAMTRNQIPGISAQYGDEFFPEASWGFGWSTNEGKKCLGYAEPLSSQKAFCQSGYGGTLLWVDPTYEIVGAYFSIVTQHGIPAYVNIEKEFGDIELMGRVDLLINAVTAAVVD